MDLYCSFQSLISVSDQVLAADFPVSGHKAFKRCGFLLPPLLLNTILSFTLHQRIISHTSVEATVRAQYCKKDEETIEEEEEQNEMQQGREYM